MSGLGRAGKYRSDGSGELQVSDERDEKDGDGEGERDSCHGA